MTDTIKIFRAYNTTSGAFLGEWTDATVEEIRSELCAGFGVAELADDIAIEPAPIHCDAEGAELEVGDVIESVGGGDDDEPGTVLGLRADGCAWIGWESGVRTWHPCSDLVLR